MLKESECVNNSVIDQEWTPHSLPFTGLELDAILSVCSSTSGFSSQSVGLGGSESVKEDTTLRDWGGEVTGPCEELLSPCGISWASEIACSLPLLLSSVTSSTGQLGSSISRQWDKRTSPQSELTLNAKLWNKSLYFCLQKG